MAQYPYNNPYQTQQPPPVAYPYSQQNDYPQAPYFPQYGQAPPTATNHNGVQASYEQNASHIPGLAFTAPARVDGLPDVPGRAEWLHHEPSAATVLPEGARYAQYHMPSQHSQPRGQARSRSPQISSRPIPARFTNTVADDIEEGELSESQFEDLYDPSNAVPQPAPSRERSNLTLSRSEMPASGKQVQATSNLAPGQSRQSQGPRNSDSEAHPSESRSTRANSVMETQASDFYEEEGEIEEGSSSAKSHLEATDPGRERSGSYSPRLSIGEIQDNGTPKSARGVHASASQEADKADKEGSPPRRQISTTFSDTAGVTDKSLNLPHAKNSADEAPRAGNTPHLRFQTVAEARQEAQKAILRLIPLGVKYQTYLDEGFDEKVIKSLFEDLQLGIPKPSHPEAKVRDQDQKGGPQPTPKQPTGSGSNLRPGDQMSQEAKAAKMPAQSQSGLAPSGASGQAEERKDRIARLLAAKAAKSGGKSKAAVTAPEPGAVAPEPKPKTKVKTQKEMLLEQKLAALEKSRQARAQRAAAAAEKKPDAVDDKAGPAQGSTVPQQAKDNKTLTSKQNANEPPPSTDALVPPKRTSPAASTQPQLGNASNTSSALPSLLPPAVAPESSQNHKKRPVAADFVEYSSAVGSTKRLFGLERSTSLVIDVSDDSDDEDMDMDLEFQSKNASTLQGRVGTPFGNANRLIRDFPPLTDTVQRRQPSNPSSGTKTATNSRPNLSRTQASEYDLKMKQIEDMKKEIAEKEAKRTSKKASTGGGTPRTNGNTPPESQDVVATAKDVDTPMTSSTEPVPMSGQIEPASGGHANATSQQPGQELDGGQNVHSSQPEQYSSLKLDRFNAALEKKKIKLAKLRAEMARLAAEVEEEEAKEKGLTAKTDKIAYATSTGAQRAANNSATLSLQEPAEITRHGSGPIAAAEAIATPTLVTDASEGEDRSGGVGDDANSVGETEAMDIDSDMSAPASPEPTAAVHERPTGLAPESNAEPGLAAVATELRPSSVSDGREGQEPSPTQGFEAREMATEEIHGNRTAVEREVVQLQVSDNDSILQEAPTRGGPDNDPGGEAMVQGSLSRGANVAEEDQTREGSSAQAPAVKLTQISTAAQVPEATQDAEADIPGEVKSAHPAPTSSTISPLGGGSFVPYQSLLQSFLAYRFHPQYRETVKGGLRSLTYSNKIDPKRAVCPSELDGEVCPRGRSCEFQHFDSMAKTESEILMDLGSSQSLSGQAKAEFVMGLRDLLADLRTRKISDFNSVATAIVQWRSNLLGDAFRILDLTGVTV